MEEPQLINSEGYFTQLKKDSKGYIYGNKSNGEILKGDPTGTDFKLLFKNEPNKYYRILLVDSKDRLWIKVNIINTVEQKFDKSYILVLDETGSNAIKLEVPSWSISEVFDVVETSSYIISTHYQGLQEFSF